MRTFRLVILLGLLISALPVAAQGGAGDALIGTINDDTPIYEIPLTVTAPHSTIIADITPTSGNLDTVLYLVDLAGNGLAENDDRARGDSSSRLVYPNAEPGDYVVIATRFKGAQGGSSGDFTLTVSIDTTPPAPLQYDVGVEALAAAGFPAIEPRPAAEWTILVYYGGDTNLEPGIMNDFNEFELAGGSNDQVRVVTLLDRVPGYTDASGDWRTARLFEVGADASADETTTYPPTLDSVPLAELGEINMGDGATLAQFLTWAITTYPAQNYVVAFGSHGAGWPGLITDETAGGDILTVPELDAAFTAAQTATGLDQFALLINDACLMSSVEYHTAMARHFALSYASPELVVDPALDMNLFTSRLRQGTEDLAAIGADLVNTYMERDVAMTGLSDAAYLSNAVTDLTVYPAVTAAVEDFAALVNNDPAQYAPWLGAARANTYTYTAFLGDSTLIDVGDFMQQVIAQSDDDELDAAAQAVIDALTAARLYGSAGAQVAAKTTYYNIYFPEKSRDFEIAYFQQSPLTEWGTMLRAYFNAVTPRTYELGTGVQLDAGLVTVPPTTPPITPPAELTFHAPRAPEVHLSSVYPSIASTQNPIQIQMEVIGRGIASGTFTADRILPDGSRVRLNQSPIYTEVLVDGAIEWLNVWDDGVDVSTFVWDATLNAVSDGTVLENEYVVDGENTSSLEGRYREPGSSTWQDVSVIFDDEGYVQRVMARAQGSDALGAIHIPTGSEFQAYRQLVTADGRTISEPGQLYTWPAGGLELFWDPAPSGTYEVGILVTGYGGTTGFDTVQVEIDNDHIDPDISGYTDIDWGLTLLHSYEWMPPSYYPDENYLYSFHESELAEFYVLVPDTDTTDPENLAWEFLESDWVDASEDTLYPTTIDGLDAYAFNFDYLNAEAILWPAWGVAIYNTHADVPLIFFVAGELDTDVMAEAFFQLHDHMTLFNVENTRRWDVAWITENARFPVLNTWLETEDDFGLRYAPSATAPTFAAISAWEADNFTAPELSGDLFAEFVAPESSELRTEGLTTYRSTYFTWAVLPYTAIRDGQAITGRFYTTIQGEDAFALWFEAPTPAAPEIFSDVFELMLDGFHYEWTD